MPAILLVDDEQNLLDIGKIYLKKNTGFTVNTLTSAQDALLFLAEHQVDVIVSDYQMPEMDGIEFLKAVRARGDETPFIIFTGKGREEVVIEALNSGADFYLQKGGEPKSQFVELAHKIQYAVSRRQDEGALVQKEAELHAILQGSPIPTFVIDRTHHVISWNRALEEITGIRAADVVGTTRHWQAFYDKERPCLADLLIDGKTGAIKDWYRGKCKKNFHIHGVYEATDFFPHLGKAGRWLHFTASLIRGEGGEGMGAVETLQDITRRVEAEEALRESEKQYRTLMEQVPELILVQRDGIIQYTNPAASKTLGQGVEEVVNRPLTDFITPEYHDRITAALRRRMSGEKVEPYEVEILGKTGGRRTAVVSGSRIEFKGAPASLIVLTDITERRKAEGALRQSEEQFRAIFHNQLTGLLMIDAATHVIIDANQTALSMIGSGKEEVIGKVCHTYICPAERGRCPVTDLGQSVDISERILINAKNERVPVLKSVNTIELGGKPYLIESFIDITDRKALQEAVQLANRKLNLLSSITRHDIINQLTILKGYIEISREYLDDKKTLVDFLEKEAKAAETIEEQIEFTKEYQEMGAAAPAWQNVNECIRNAMAALPMGAIHVEPDPANPEVYADPLFDKVFYNLIDNALRYGGEGMTAIHVSSHASDDGLIIICEDDGVGITKEDKKSLFSRGFGKNTGLGLFLVKEILSITCITITENGTPGKGARFEIKVPKGAYQFTDIVTQ